MKKKKSKAKFFRVYSIKTKLIIIFSILILLEIAAIGFVTLKSSYDALINKTEDALVSLSRESAKLTKSRLEGQMRTLETIASISDVQSMDWSIQLPVLEEQINRTGFLDFAVVDLNGVAKYTGGYSTYLGNRDYINKALTGESAISDLISNVATGSSVFMFATPIYKGGDIVGVLVSRNDGEFLTDLINDIGYGENGYGYMIDKSGAIVAHPNHEYVLQQFNPLKEYENKELEPLANLFREILNDREGAREYYFNDTDLYAGFAPVEGTNWFFVTTANKDEILSDIPILFRDIIVFSSIILVISIVLVLIFGNLLTTAIFKGIEQIKKIAKFDISENIPPKFLNRKDEIGDVARALQDITFSLRNMINNIIESSKQLSASSQELASISQESAATSEEVSNTIQSIAKSAKNQAKNVEVGVEKSTALGKNIEDAQESMKNLSDSTDKVASVVVKGLEDIEKLSDITKESNEAIRVIYDVILKTNKSAKEIAKASQLIAMIAKETNLLAVNAAIEAARAGEYGKTFSVVADRIRNLAEESSESISTINAVVKELQENSENSVKIIDRIVKITEEQSEGVKESKDEYLIISEAMKDAAIDANKIAVMGQQIVNMKDEILDILHSLSIIAEENSAATQQVSSAMQQQSASVEEMASSSESMSFLAKELQGIVGEFKVG